MTLSNSASSDSSMSAVDSYQSRIRELEAELEKDQSLSKMLVSIRVVTALSGLALIVFGIAEPSVGSWTWQLGIAMIVAFLGFATWYEIIQWRLEQTKSHRFGFQRLVDRVHRQWDRLQKIAAEDECKSFATEWTKDLDIFGDRSLFRWCSLAMTTTGARTISRWITSWASTATILERQEAVQELQSHREWRLRFFEVACGLRDQRTSPEAIVSWAESDDHFAKKRLLVPFTWFGPVLFWGGLIGLSIALTGENNVVQMLCLGCLLAGLAFNFLLSLFIIGPIHDLFHRIGAANCELQILRTWIQTAREMPHASSFNSRIHHALFDRESDADAAIGKLQGWMVLAGFQRSPLFFLPYLLLQFTTLWDIRILSGLEKWKRMFGKHARSWIDSLGMLDAITSASAIADEHPTWAYPKILDRGALLSTDGMAHPLLKDKQRVPNNLAIDEERRLLLVTGSNMAGKSTLLRSVGVNTVLARLGSPVCANSWVGESFDIASSIRVQDSLQDGVSFFMAELKRLRSVVDQAIEESKPDGKRMIILLDEILQGTNSRERQIAVDSVLRRLVDLGCIVLASTHDLELASHDKMQLHAQIVHFREHFEMVDGKQIMRFDYIMRSGVTPTTNALKLLELVGL
jgi:hypothetical protein